MTTAPHTPSDGCFLPTRWTLVLRAKGESPEAREALSALCEAYWQPVLRFLRREGRNDDSARELAQEFFSRLLAGGGLNGVDPERGRFRSFLLGAVKHFLADVRDHERRLKRGGGIAPESLEAARDEESPTGLEVPDPGATIVDEVFDREWALALMSRSLSVLENELVGEGKGAQFAVLKPWLAGDSAGPTHAGAAQELGLSEGAVKVLIHRLRKRFREVVKSEVEQTVGQPALVPDELRYLVAVLSHQPSLSSRS